MWWQLIFCWQINHDLPVDHRLAPFSPCGRRVGDEGALADGTAGAVQDARAGPSTGFRPPFGLGRVTFLCVAKEKSPKERPPPPIRWLRQSPQFRANVGRAAADGTLAYAIHGFGQSPLRTSLFSRQIGVEQCSPCSDLAPARCGYAIIPDGVPDVASAPRRIGGGSKPCQHLTWGILYSRFSQNEEQQSRMQI